MAITEHTLIDGEQLKHALEEGLAGCTKQLVFVSAYITQTAVDWLKKHAPDNVHIHLICRLIPSDVINGATQISALMTALDNGWQVSCLHSLHAKIYSIDDRIIYVGSANLTSNGLRIYGSGNLEACCNVPASEESLRFIANIVGSSTSVVHDILKKMEEYIANKEPAIHFDTWPEGTLPQEEGMWVRDFFWFNPQSNQPQGNEKSHDIEIIAADSLDTKSKQVREQVLRSRCIQWLILKLENEPESELYFGKLSRLLHDELKDDPAPYRKDVKGLVQNLLAYCQIFLPETIEVSQPNHSQRVKLLVTG